MKEESLKRKVLRSWQEIFFIIPIGIFLFDVLIGQPKIFYDGLGIATFCFHLVLFIYLVGQLFWKSVVLSSIFSPFVVLYSIFWIFSSVYMLIANSDKILYTAIFFLTIFSIFPAFTMLRKYGKKDVVGVR